MPEPIHINRIREILNAFLVDAANAREANQGIYVSALTELSGALPEPSGVYNNDEVRRLIRDASEALSRSGTPLSEDAIAQRLFAEVEFSGGRVVRDNRGNPVVNYDPVTGLGAGVEGGLTATQTLVLSEFTRELDERNPLYMTSGRKIVHLASQMQQNGLISAPLYNMMVSHDFSPQNIAALQATYPDVDVRDAYQLVSQFEQQLAGSVNGLQSATPGRSWDQIVTTSVRRTVVRLKRASRPTRRCWRCLCSDTPLSNWPRGDWTTSIPPHWAVPERRLSRRRPSRRCWGTGSQAGWSTQESSGARTAPSAVR